MAQPTPVSPSTTRRILSLAFSALLLLGAFWFFFNRQTVQDWYILSGYQPPAPIAALATAAEMSEHGKQRFFVNKPELRSKTNFSEGCQQTGDEKSNVLGCFTGQKIYIFDVSDPRLAGVKEVTAAHEMLHSAYIRLNPFEKKRVDDLLQRQLDTYTAPHVKELIEIYNRLEPGELFNEMHSILATEQHEISAELEAYFKQYFTDRLKVVAMADAYRNVFDTLQQQQNQLVNELNALADEINNTTTQLNADIETLNADVEVFNRQAESGAMTQATFEQQRSLLTQRKNAINLRLDQNAALRNTYEQKRREYEALALDSANLQKSIDSRPAAPENL